MKILHDLFTTTASAYSQNVDLIATYWNEIETSYSSKNRFYHNLSHLENMLGELEPVRLEIRDWNVIVFALFYHDIVYHALRNDNEAQSANLAASRLAGLSVHRDQIETCTEMILATKGHQASEVIDINFFTDADLSILGSDTDAYQQYSRNIRNEYRWVPDVLYKPGRKKILTHFLRMSSIYKTHFFRKKYEAPARVNLARELDSLA